jgi:hypothetical protein
VEPDALLLTRPVPSGPERRALLSLLADGRRGGGARAGGNEGDVYALFDATRGPEAVLAAAHVVDTAEPAVRRLAAVVVEGSDAAPTLGTRLLIDLLDAQRAAGVRSVLALVDGDDRAVRCLTASGFVPVDPNSAPDGSTDWVRVEL